MDSNEHNKVIAFDTLFCTNHIQMLKIILSYMDNQTQKSMAIFIKFLELNYTIDYFKKHPHRLYSCAPKESSFDIFKMCAELFPFCTESERRQLEQIKGVFQGIEMYKEISKTMDMMKDFMPDMADFMGDSSMNNAFSAFFGGDGLSNSGNRNDFSFDGAKQDDSSHFSPNGSDKDDNDRGNDNSSDNDDSVNSTPPPETGGFNMMNMLMNMLTPEQKQMYEMFGGNQHAE
ncbi:hypothetical protein [Parablautia muri]|uniref:Uncharacterized protein n=1 Tax=Parablautia muri TaxID=2320879 RepID=A0A9X5BEJ9_9FIRM|nr:hypothetical protein [Parablautia muri]NBJ92173.1 hypothetical protein [Parablautia muri]